MKHWKRDSQGYYNLAIDEDEKVVSIYERTLGIIEITEECDQYFGVEMSKVDFIEALRELADELEGDL